MSSRDGQDARRSFGHDLFAQLYSDASRLDPGRICAYNAFLGVILFGGTLVLQLSGPPRPLGPLGLGLVAGSGLALLAGLLAPRVGPRGVRAVLAVHGALVVLLTVGFAVSCVQWALAAPPRGSFRYLPGLLVVGFTYGAAQEAELVSPPPRARAWRRGGFLVGVVVELIVAVVVLQAVVSD